MLKSVTICDIQFDIFPIEDQILRLKPRHDKPTISLPKIAEQIDKNINSGISDVIGTRTEIMIFGEDIDFEKIAGINLETSSNQGTLLLPIYVEGGKDLDFVLSSNTLTEYTFKKILIESSLKVSHFGFIPGFTYIEGLPEILHTARKKTPIGKCSPRSIGIGGPYLGIYNYPSPAGWHLIGTTPLRFDVETMQEISIGQTMKIELITEQTYDNILSRQLSIKSYNAKA